MKKKTDRQGIFLLRFEIYNGSLMKHLLLGRGGRGGQIPVAWQAPNTL